MKIGVLEETWDSTGQFSLLWGTIKKFKCGHSSAICSASFVCYSMYLMYVKSERQQNTSVCQQSQINTFYFNNSIWKLSQCVNNSLHQLLTLKKMLFHVNTSSNQCLIMSVPHFTVLRYTVQYCTAILWFSIDVLLVCINTTLLHLFELIMLTQHLMGQEK